MKIASLAVSVGILLGAILAVPQDRQDIPTFASKVELVTVDAVVVDGKGQPVRGLTALDFALFEDGKPQKVESFEAFDLGEGPERSAATAPLEATNLRASSPGSRTFVLLVDDVGLAPSRQPVIRKVIARFMETGLRDGDEVIFATTSGDAWWSARMPEGREDVAALAARVQGRNLGNSGSDAMSDWEAYRINRFENGAGDSPGALITARVMERYLESHVCDQSAMAVCYQVVRQRAQELDQRRVNRTQDTFATVDRAVFALTGVRGRKSLLLLTEGFLHDTNLAFVREVTGRCREANLVVYSLDVRGLMTGQPAAEDFGLPNIVERIRTQVEETAFAAAGSEALAEDTGGFAVSNTNDPAAGAARVADESRTYYLLGYAPPEGKGPRDWRQVKVEIKRPGLKVRARKGYTFRTDAEIARAAETPVADGTRGKPKAKGSKDALAQSKLDADVARALVRAQDADGIPIRAMAYTFEDRPAGSVRTLLAIEIDAGARARLAASGHARPVFTLYVAVAHRDSGRTQRLDQRLELEAGRAKAGDGWLTLSREFDVRPGVAQARVVVRDETGGQLGALSLRFVVPAVSAFRLSTPVLTDRVTTADLAAPGRPVLTAHREFRPEGRIYCQFQVFGPAKASWPAGAIEASYVLRRREGPIADQSDPSPIRSSPDGRLVRLLVLSIEGMAPGDYELVLRVFDRVNKETREQVESFRILPAPG
jgi:VWFA-related protein